MLTIHKYTLVLDDYITVSMPKDSLVLTVDIQHNRVQLWALVDVESGVRQRTFRLAGTGHPVKEYFDVLNYIGTFQLQQGDLIFHLFEIKED